MRSGGFFEFNVVLAGLAFAYLVTILGAAEQGRLGSRRGTQIALMATVLVIPGLALLALFATFCTGLAATRAARAPRSPIPQGSAHPIGGARSAPGSGTPSWLWRSQHSSWRSA